MPLEREITKPTLGLDQEPTAIAWKSTLRSPTQSARGPAESSRKSRSRTRSSGGPLQTSIRSRTPSPSLRASNSFETKPSNVRKSQSGKLGASFSKSQELKEIEGDYVKNLQQQVYFLELEANYLRDQARKATEMHPQMTAEAERMLTKLRTLQSEIDGLGIENRRKDASIQLITKEKSKCLARLAEEENQKERMKRNLLEEIEVIRKERDRVTLDNTRLDNQLDRVIAEKDSLTIRLGESQDSIVMLRQQLAESIEQHRITKLNLEDKRSDCVKAEVRARDIEDHYLNVTQRKHEKEINQHKDELSRLHQTLRETEREADSERFLKTKTESENDQLLQANSTRKQQIADLTLQLEQECGARVKLEDERNHDLARIANLSDKGIELSLELKSMEEQLLAEKTRSETYAQQIRRLEDDNSNLQLNNSSLNKQLSSSEITVSSLNKENDSLRRDKDILTDHVADLQRQLSMKSSELAVSGRQIRELQDDLHVVQTDKSVGDAMQSDKWREFETLADSMKQLSRTMAHTSTASRSPRSKSRPS